MTYTDTIAPTGSTTATIEASLEAQQLLPANSSRAGLYVSNAGTSAMYLLFKANTGGEVSYNHHTLSIKPGCFYEMPLNYYAGEVRCIWVSSSSTVDGNATVTEFVK